MKWRMAVLVMAVAALRLSAADVPRSPNIGTLAEGCVITKSAGCNSLEFGQLTEGDCITDTGEFLDVFEFPATPGKVTSIALRPLDATYTNASVLLTPPIGNGARPPAMLGGKYGEIWYQLTGGGDWRVGVTSRDLFARGAYALHIDCFDDDRPTLPAGCVDQYLSCNQTATWQLDASSCSASDGRGFANFWVWGVAGDVLQFEMGSNSFEPYFSIHNENGTLLQRSNQGAGVDRATFVVPANGWYVIAPTSRAPGGGFFYLDLKCASSGCIFPFIRNPIRDFTVEHGRQAVIRADVHYDGGGPLLLELIDAETGAVIATSSGTSVQTPAITRMQRFAVRATTGCGSYETFPFMVLPETPKRRSVRK